MAQIDEEIDYLLTEILEIEKEIAELTEVIKKIKRKIERLTVRKGQLELLDGQFEMEVSLLYGNLLEAEAEMEDLRRTKCVIESHFQVSLVDLL